MTEPRIWDAIVIGGGSAGLSAALALGRALRRTLVLDTGQPRNRFAEHMHTVLGQEGTNPLDLLARGREEAGSYGVQFRIAEVLQVTQPPTPEQPAPHTLEVSLANGAVLTTRAVIAASGVRDLLPEIPGLHQRWGKTVLHCPYCHGTEYAGQRIGVLALSPMGLHHAELLRQWTQNLTFFSAGAGELDAATTRRLESRGIHIDPRPVTELRGDPEGPATVVTEDGFTQELDAIFTLGQVIPNDEYLSHLELERADTPAGSFLQVDHGGQTSHPRVWAAGNIASPMANVPMSISAGTFAGAMANGVLVTEDFDLAEQH
ncbi:NAD(P)/FAD-dependent oxidoreductase [Nesterenkonia alba]|uniref:NAD(P)/FAD-dependent oxidoreductase n=1 Tax=Nesterenkonia alba TaxID=515814 RepID=UPI0003B57425|nr:NAD(P)/FAD-dependent oxidoreductase [Nesterenkonia alba]